MRNIPLKPRVRCIEDLRPYSSNARIHSRKQIKQIATSIERFGFTNPVLVDPGGRIIAGHGRVEAAKLLGWAEVPTLEVAHLTPAEFRAYVLADNKLALNAGWDPDVLAIELQALIDLDFDVSVTGFSMTEVDLTLDAAAERSSSGNPSPEDHIPPFASRSITSVGDIWIMGQHRLICGDARNGSDFSALLQDERADIVFTDPPYNVPIEGHVSGLGRARHREFAMASGEMSSGQFAAFLEFSLKNVAAGVRDGAIAFVCMDWRHVGELLLAGSAVFDELKNICVWNKTNAGMGTFYRSKFELVFVFKKGNAPHVNNFGLGDSGRYRTNVWDYPGLSSLGPGRSEALEMHPTVKPVRLVADALRDCSNRGDIVLDPFAGSGTTLIAAHTCGRVARLIEYDPAYCDLIVRRYSAYTGKDAVLASSGDSFERLEERLAPEGAAA